MYSYTITMIQFYLAKIVAFAANKAKSATTGTTSKEDDVEWSRYEIPTFLRKGGKVGEEKASMVDELRMLLALEA